MNQSVSQTEGQLSHSAAPASGPYGRAMEDQGGVGNEPAADEELLAAQRRRPRDPDVVDEAGVKEPRAGKEPLKAVTYTGRGLLSAFGLSNVANEALVGAGGDVDEVAALLDNGVNETSADGVGVRRAFVDTVQQMAAEVATAHDKTTTVLFVALRRALRLLEQHGCAGRLPQQQELLAALCIFNDNAALANMMRELATMANDWGPRNAGSTTLWATTWRPFTDIVEAAAQEVRSRLPDADELRKLVVADAGELEHPVARRLHAAIVRALADGSPTATTLSTSVLTANTRNWAAAITNHINAELGPDVRAITRVVVQRVAVTLTADDQLVAQRVGKKALKAVVADVAKTVVLVDDDAAGPGLLWRPTGVGAPRRMGGIVADGRRDDAAAWPPDNNDVGALLASVSAGGLAYAPLPLLRGFQEMPADFAGVAAAPHILVISCDANDPGSAVRAALAPHLFVASAAGALVRALLQPLWRKWRKCAVVCTTTRWAGWWASSFREIGAGERLTVLRLVADLSADVADAGQDYRVPDPAAMLRLADDDDKARAINKWFNFVANATSDGPTAADDGDAGPLREKWSAREYFHRCLAPTYPLTISGDAFDRLNDANVASAPITDVNIQVLAAPFASPAVVVRAWAGHEGWPEFVAGQHDHGWAGRMEAQIAAVRTIEEARAVALPGAGIAMRLATGARRVLHVSWAPHDSGPDLLCRPDDESAVARLATRAAGVPDAAVTCCYALPTNMDWDALVRCPGCAPVPTAPSTCGLYHAPKAPVAPRVGQGAEARQQTDCNVCLARFNAVSDALRLILLLNVRVASLADAAAAGAGPVELVIVPWGRDARELLAKALDPAHAAASPWVRAEGVKIRLPDHDVPGLGDASVATTDAAVTWAVKGAIVAFKHVAVGVLPNARVKALKAQLLLLNKNYDARHLASKKMEVLGHVRRLCETMLDSAVRRANRMAGNIDASDPPRGLPVIDLRTFLNRLCLLYVLQDMANCPLYLVEQLKRVPPPTTAEPAASKKRAPSSTSTPARHPDAESVTSSDRRRVARACYEHFVKQAGAPEVERAPLLERLRVNRQVDHWKRAAGRDFEAAVTIMLRGAPDPAVLAKYAPAQLLAATEPVADGSFKINVEALRRQVAAGSVLAPASKPSPPARPRPPPGFLFMPKRPTVKLLPDVSFSVQHVAISKIVAGEAMVRAMRRVVEPANLLALGVSRDAAERVLRAAVTAAFAVQRAHFGGDVEAGPGGGAGKSALRVPGTLAQLQDALNATFQAVAGGGYSAQPHSVAQAKGRAAALMLAAFDWRIVHPRHTGKLFASSDGVAVHLSALPKRTSKWAGPAAPPPPLVVDRHVALQTTVVGADYGKSGVAATVAPKNVQDAVHTKAAAEADFARAQERLAKAQRTEQQARKATEAATQVKRAKTAVAKEQAGVDEARATLAQATLDEQRARAVFGTNRNKGAHCVGTALHNVETARQRERDVREERLALFDKCLAGGATHRTLAESVVSLHSVEPGEELRAAASRQRLFWLLQIAHSSHAVRQQQRSQEKLKRGFTSRYARLITKELPDAAANTPANSFLQQNVAFPARSPQSRARERIRGWERGARVAAERVAAANGDQERARPAQPRPPVRVSVDKCPSKGQRTTSSFPYASLHRSMARLIKTCPLSKRIMVHIENGYRSSRQAAGLMSYLANMPRADHRSVKPTDAQHAWQSPMVNEFKFFFCPVTERIMARDPPAALSMVAIGTCALHGAPRHTNFCP